jgi:hypothetical protein
MLTAMRAVENLLTGSQHDIWEVNVESAYHEIDVAPEQPYRTVPHLNEPLDPLTEAPDVGVHHDGSPKRRPEKAPSMRMQTTPD